MTVTVERPEIPVHTSPPGPSSFRGALGRREITRPFGTHLAGYGPFGRRASRGVYGRSWATAMVMEDASGARIALVAADLHAVSRMLVERVVAALDPALGVGVERLFAVATHTHSSPSHFYGSHLYDQAGSPGASPGHPGFDEATTAALVAAIAGAIGDAAGALQPCTLHVGHGTVRGALWQRNFESWIANFEDLEGPRRGRTDRKHARALQRRLDAWDADPARVSTLAVALSERTDPDTTGSARRRAVDARLDVYSLRSATGDVLGGIGFLHATPTLLGKLAGVQSPDVAGEAVRRARRAVPGGIFALAGGAHGDVNVVDPASTVEDLKRTLHDPHLGHPGFSTAGSERARTQMIRTVSRAGAAIADAFVAGLGGPPIPEPEIRWARAEADVTDRSTPALDTDLIGFTPGSTPARTSRDLALCEDAVVGTTFFHMSELAQPRGTGTGDAIHGEKREPHRKHADGQAMSAALSGSAPWSSVHGASSTRREAAHFPKRTPVGQKLFHLLPSLQRVLPVLAVSFTGTNGRGAVLVGLPTEPSTAMGWRARALVRTLPGLADHVVTVAAPCGEYSGYALPPREYVRTPYEAGATWWGRDFGVLLENTAKGAVAALSIGGPWTPAIASGGTQSFRTGATSGPLLGDLTRGWIGATAPDPITPTLAIAPPTRWWNPAGWTPPPGAAPPTMARLVTARFGFDAGTSPVTELAGHDLIRVSVITPAGAIVLAEDDLGVWAELVHQPIPPNAPLRAQLHVGFLLPVDPAWPPGSTLRITVVAPPGCAIVQGRDTAIASL